jgi:hypothetical protein
MDRARHYELEVNPTAKLSDEELRAGWHFCPDWNFMLVGPGMRAMDACSCKEQK